MLTIEAKEDAVSFPLVDSVFCRDKMATDHYNAQSVKATGSDSSSIESNHPFKDGLSTDLKKNNNFNST